MGTGFTEGRKSDSLRNEGSVEGFLVLGEECDDTGSRMSGRAIVDLFGRSVADLLFELCRSAGILWQCFL